jgi:hypothetical protein
MRLFFILLLCLLSGCVTEINSLEGRIPDSDYRLDRNKTVVAIKQWYFTKEAQEVIKDIPCVDGLTYGGSYVVGANFWGTLVGILTGSGFSPKCVMSPTAMKNYGAEAVLHEYMHHLEDLVDHDEFKEAYIAMSADFQWAGLYFFTEKRANRWVTNTFGISEMSEYIAYLAAKMAHERKGPEYMWHVFRNVLTR